MLTRRAGNESQCVDEGTEVQLLQPQWHREKSWLKEARHVQQKKVRSHS